MSTVTSDFQIFVKPIGALCNLDCYYCYYLKKKELYNNEENFQMKLDVLENYIIQHIQACQNEVIQFSWHGGEPTLLGLNYFKKIVELQKKHKPPKKRVLNGVQTNGTLLNGEWIKFFVKEGFAIGLSLDGPQPMHDRYRVTKDKKSTYQQVINSYKLLKKLEVHTDILCVVSDSNVKFPKEVYNFFKQLNVEYLTFLPLIEFVPGNEKQASPQSISAKDWGNYLCTIFDEWVEKDIGKIKIQIFEEALRAAFNQEHSLCIFRSTCGNIPVIEHNGDFYSCDHFVDPKHNLGNIMKQPLIELLESSNQKAFGEAKNSTLPKYCRECNVLNMCNGECPKNRFIKTSDGEEGLNYLCEGYKKFFNHCKPFINQVATLWRQQK